MRLEKDWNDMKPYPSDSGGVCQWMYLSSDETPVGDEFVRYLSLANEYRSQEPFALESLTNWFSSVLAGLYESHSVFAEAASIIIPATPRSRHYAGDVVRARAFLMSNNASPSAALPRPRPQQGVSWIDHAGLECSAYGQVAGMMIEAAETLLVKSTRAVQHGSQTVLLREDQINQWGSLLQEILASLTTICPTETVLVYASLGSLVIEVGPKERTLSITIDETSGEATYRKSVEDFNAYETIPMSAVPTKAEIAKVWASYMVRPAWKTTEKAISITSNTSDAAYASRVLIPRLPSRLTEAFVSC
jgi:hypothetical protein